MNIHSWIVFLGPLSSFLSTVLPLKHKTDIDPLFRFLFLLMLVVEILGYGIPRISEWDNYFIYNTYTVIFFLCCFRFYFQLTKSDLWKKVIYTFSAILIPLFLIVTYYNGTFFSDVQVQTFYFGCIVTTILAVRYLLSILRSEEIYDFYRSRSFWISCGLLVFCIPFIPIIVSYKYMLFDYKTLEILKSLLIIFMHICFIISFQWTLRR